MKTRVISAIIILLLLIPIILKGGILFNITATIIGTIALYEFIKIKESKKDLPIFIKAITFLIMVLIMVYSSNTTNLNFSIDIRVITTLFLIFLLPTVLYHDKSRYSVNDAFYLIGAVFFLGISFSLIMLVREMSLFYLIYLVVITTITDTYAYTFGRLIGKHKMLTEISPKKTWEGFIGGTIAGTSFGVVFLILFIKTNIPVHVIILMTLFLSIIGQFGDLVFSAIKRYFKVKDFSNIIPGHGGILDRLDSIIFVIISFTFFINFI